MRTNRPKPEVGQTLYSLNVGNASRGRGQVLTPVKVTKVGRKYFYAAAEGREDYPTTFHLGSWHERTEYTANQKLYADPQERENEKESTKLLRLIRQNVDRLRIGDLPVGRLRHIAKSLDIEVTDE